MKKLTLSFILLGVGLLSWLMPLMLPAWFGWLTIGWQILLSILCFTFALILGLWDIWVQKRKKNKDIRELSSHEKRQHRQALYKNWSTMWKKIRHMHGSNPYKLSWLLLIGSKHSGKSLWLSHAGFTPVNNHPDFSQFGITLWQSSDWVVIEHSHHNDGQEVNEIADDLYHYLIKLLKHKRPRQPLTAIISMLPANQLATHSPFKLQEHASRLHDQLSELNREYRIQIPLWLLVSKADRLNGFSDFFRNISQQQQISPWGFSLKEGSLSAGFSSAFKQFHQHLFSMMFMVLQREKDQNARQALVRFTLQFALLGERLKFYCSDLFRQSTGRMPLIVKGVWFCSNTQEHSSINLLACELAKVHGFKAFKETQQTQDGQRYFNHNFLSQVIHKNLGDLPENPIAHTLWQLKTAGMAVGVALIFIAGLTFCWQQVRLNNNLIQQQKTIIHNYKASIKQLNIVDGNMNAIDLLYSLRILNNQYQDSSQWFYHLGLRDWKQAKKVHNAYLQQLQQWLLTPLEKEFRAHLQSSEIKQQISLYNNLRLYLVLFHPDKNYASKSEVLQWVIKHKHLNENQSRKLNLLLDDLWALNVQRNKPDMNTIETARQQLTALPIQNIIYDNIRIQPHYLSLISMPELFGSYFDDFFQLTATHQNQNGIPRLYTANEYHSLDLSAESALLKQEVARLNLIRKGSSSATLVELNQVSRKVRSLYFQDYIQAWQNLLSRIVLKPTHSLPELNDQLYGLYYGEQMPLLEIIKKVAHETQQLSADSNLLSSNPVEDVTKSLSVNEPNRVTPTQKKLLQNTSEVLPPAPSDNPAIVSQYFADYASFEQEQAPTLKPVLLATLKAMQTMSSSVQPQQSQYKQAVQVLSGKNRVIHDLWQFADSDNTVAGEWVGTIANTLWKYVLEGTSRYVQKQWEQSVYTFYSQYLSQRFPLTQHSVIKSKLDDFIEFFKVNGKFDQFIQTVLQPFIVKASGGWQPINVKDQHLDISKAFLNQINNVNTLQKALFNQGQSLQIHYEMRCIYLSPEVTDLSIRDNNGRFVYRHGPRLWQERQWPTDEAEQLSISLLKEQQPLSQMSFNGPWGWLQFVFSCNQWQKDNVTELKCSQKGYPFDLEMTFNQRLNPFNPKLFQHINLPEQIIRYRSGNP